MSASIDQEDSTDPGGGAREVLASWLDAHAAGECDTPTMQGGFLEACRRNGEAPWDALALLDQYQRRGKLEPDVARTLKSEIAQMVFGTPTESAAHAPRPDAASQSGRWRRSDMNPPAADEEEADEEDKEEEELEPELTRSRMPAPDAAPRVPPRAMNPPVKFPVRNEVRPATHPPQMRVLRGRYELQDVLGRGADGIEYRALDRNRQHLAQPQRYVAVKLLNNDPPLHADALVEYQRRAHLAQSLVHPHMVRVFDFDHDADVHFLVMEMLQGEPLDTLMAREGRMGLTHERALRIIADIGSALAYAHEHGVIFGNLTPRKVIVTPAGEAKLIDAGFASVRAEPTQHSDGEQQYAARYGSAERVSGEPLTTSDDVYSLACIAYELLTHGHPYDGRSGAAARVQQQRPHPIRSLPRPAWLALERALRWNRLERDLTASQLVTALTGAEVVAEPELAIRAPRRDAEEATRSHTGAWLIAIALVLLAGGLAWWLLPAPERAQVRGSVAAMQDAVLDADAPTAPVPPSSTDTARALEGGQLIPAQPAGSATGPSALEALTKSPTGTAAVPAATPPAAATPATPQADANRPSATTPKSGAAPNEAPASAGPGSGVIGFPKDTYVVRESDVVVRIPVVRTRGTRGEVSFRWSIERNSAEPASDFASVGPGREYMAAGQSSTVLHIPLVSDSEREGTEMFLVHIDEVGSGARAGELTRAAVIVVDDD